MGYTQVRELDAWSPEELGVRQCTRCEGGGPAGLDSWSKEQGPEGLDIWV